MFGAIFSTIEIGFNDELVLASTFLYCEKSFIVLIPNNFLYAFADLFDSVDFKVIHETFLLFINY